MERDADVVIIGGGVIGTALLYELSKLDLHAVLLEKELDIGMGATKANSGILHAGFDPVPGSWKARMNNQGNRLYHELEKELDLPIRWTGSLAVAFGTAEEQVLGQLLQRGRENGVEGLAIWSGGRARGVEPSLSPAVTKALWAPTAGICWPFGVAQAFAENAIINGSEIWRDSPVKAFVLEHSHITKAITPQGTVCAKYFINAAGLAAGAISQLAGDDSITVNGRKGEYILFDKNVRGMMPQRAIFPVPDLNGKGILVSPTYDGNIFIGPNASMTDHEDNATTVAGMEQVIMGAAKLVSDLPLGETITTFAGIRAVTESDDFILGWSHKVMNLLQAAGISSPGLTSAPAIARYLTGLIREDGGYQYRQGWLAGRPACRHWTNVSEDWSAAIAEDHRYGRIICRCEHISEGEILDAIHRPCGARTVDGVKRRTRAGMGRCQGGFCGPRVAEILSRELHLPLARICKDKKGSFVGVLPEEVDGYAAAT